MQLRSKYKNLQNFKISSIYYLQFNMPQKIYLWQLQKFLLYESFLNIQCGNCYFAAERLQSHIAIIFCLQRAAY